MDSVDGGQQVMQGVSAVLFRLELGGFKVYMPGVDEPHDQQSLHNIVPLWLTEGKELREDVETVRSRRSSTLHA